MLNTENNPFGTNDTMELYNPFTDNDTFAPSLDNTTPTMLPSSPSIITNDTKLRREEPSTKLVESESEIVMPSRDSILNINVESIKTATIMRNDVVRGKTTKKSIGAVMEDDTMFGMASVIKPEFEVLGLAPVAGNISDDITLLEITTTYFLSSSPIKYYNILHGYTTSTDYDAEIHVSTTHSYYLVNGVKHNVVNERIVTQTDMDELMLEYKLGPINKDIELNADLYKGVNDVRVINGQVSPITPSGSFEYLKNPVPKFVNKQLLRLHLAPLYNGLITLGVLADAQTLTINKLKKLSPTVNVLHVTQDLFNDFLKYVKDNKVDFGSALKEVLAVGDEVNGNNKYHVMGIALNEAVKAGMVKAGIQTITLSLVFREADVNIHINHYTNRANVTERTVNALTNSFSRILYQDLKPFMLEWEGREVHGTFRVDGTSNNIYVVDVINGRTIKEKVSIATTSEIASANFSDMETISNIATALSDGNIFGF